MKRKGISLIVLIITVVVIIILAAAIILNLSNTNLIENANEAVVKQDVKSFQDELTLYIADQYTDTLGKFKAEDLDVTKEEMAKIIPSIADSKYEGYFAIEDGKLTVLDTMPDPQKTWAMKALGLDKPSTNVPTEPEETATPVVAVNTTVQISNATITGEEFAYNNPVIPVGFKAVNTSKASWNDENNDGIVDGWNNGLVLMDGEENEYVWIPVDGTNVTYSKWNGSRKADYLVTKEQVEDDTLPTGIISETDQIKKYGGFYVARYEAGLPDSQTTEDLMITKTFSAADNNRTDIGKAQSKPNKIVWTNIGYGNAKAVSESIISNNYVQSGLITGFQWDTMVRFLSHEIDVDIDCTSWGNYLDKYGYTINGYYKTGHSDVVYIKGEYNKAGAGYLLLTTGKFGSVVVEGNPKNFCDVAGNVWELCTETVTDPGDSKVFSGYKVIRGGSYVYHGYKFSPTCRYGLLTPTGTYPDIGFRFVLYVK